MSHIIAHDIGTSSVKSVVTRGDGVAVASTSRALSVSIPAPGHVEQAPNDWWQATVANTKTLLSEASLTGADVSALTFTGQLQGTVAVDAQGVPLMPAMIWLDMRAAAHAAEATRGLVRFEGYGLWRLLTWLRLSNGAPSLSGRDTISRILWLQHEAPNLWRRVHKLLDVKDWLLHRCTGEFVTGVDSANTGWLMDTRPGHMCWSSTLTSMMGIDIEQLPTIRAGHEAAGELTEEAARTLGLQPGTPVVTGVGDIAAMAIGTGEVGTGDVTMGLGTSGWVTAHLDKRTFDVANYTATICSAIPGKHLLAAHQETGGACLSWLRRQWAHGDVLPSYEDIQHAAHGVAPGADGLRFAPWLNGEYAPIDDPNVRGGWFNLSLAHDRGHMARALLEGIALNLRWALATVEKNQGEAAGHIRLAGGGANSDVWSQIIADACQRPVLQMQSPGLATAHGAALLGAVGISALPSFESVTEAVAIERTFEPNLELAGLYDDAFGQLKTFYSNNKRFYRQLNGRADAPADATAAVPELTAAYGSQNQ